MNRWFPRPPREALFAAMLAALGTACSPDNSVKPGAPVLMSLTIIEATGAYTSITPTTTDCVAGTTDGLDCDPAEPVCRATSTLCYCAPKGEGDCTIDPNVAATQGSWVCHYGPQAQVMAVFDRLLDGELLDGGDGAPRSDIVTFGSTPPAAGVTTSTGYTPNGLPVGLIFPLFGFPSGPSLLVNTDPAIPANDATVSYQLDATRVRAKDGKTPYTGEGFLQDGTISFATNPFAVGITVPVAPPPPPPSDDGGTDGAADDGGLDGGVPDAALDAEIPEAGSGRRQRGRRGGRGGRERRRRAGLRPATASARTRPGAARHGSGDHHLQQHGRSGHDCRPRLGDRRRDGARLHRVRHRHDHGADVDPHPEGRLAGELHHRRHRRRHRERRVGRRARRG